MANQQTAFRLTKPGIGTQGIVKVQDPIPTPGAYEVLVRIHAVSLNYRDVALLLGTFVPRFNENSVLGSDMGGEVVAVGPSATQFKKGNRVTGIFNQSHIYGDNVDGSRILGGSVDGVLQEYRVFHEQHLLGIPDHLSYEEASCFPIAAVTAWNALFGGKQLVPGQTVICQGTGGVSIFALSLAHAAGATTIVTSSSDDKLVLAKKLGATHVINYRTTPNWDEVVSELTKGRGVHHIIDNAGVNEIERCFNCIARGGVINNIGFLGGEPKISPNVPMLCLKHNASLRGIHVGSKQQFEQLLRFVEQKQLRPSIDKAFSFEQTVDAFKYLESGAHFGKVVVRVSSE